MAVEIKLSDGTILRTGKDSARPDDYTSKLVSRRTYVPITTEDGQTYVVNPEQVVYLRAVV
jgi:hypothetical protein